MESPVQLAEGGRSPGAAWPRGRYSHAFYRHPRSASPESGRTTSSSFSFPKCLDGQAFGRRSARPPILHFDILSHPLFYLWNSAELLRNCGRTLSKGKPQRS